MCILSYSACQSVLHVSDVGWALVVVPTADAVLRHLMCCNISNNHTPMFAILFILHSQFKMSCHYTIYAIHYILNGLPLFGSTTSLLVAWLTATVVCSMSVSFVFLIWWYTCRGQWLWCCVVCQRCSLVIPRLTVTVPVVCVWFVSVSLICLSQCHW